MSLPPLQRVGSESISGLSTSYNRGDHRSPLLKLLHGQHVRQAGERVPDMELKPALLTAETSTSVRLYDLLRQAVYSLFIVVSPEWFERDRQHFVCLLERLKPYMNETIRPYVVFEQGSEAIAHELPVTTLLDFKQQFHHKLGTQHGSILLVRPDGYVALHVPKLSQAQFLSDLQSWVMLAQQEAVTLLPGRA